MIGCVCCRVPHGVCGLKWRMRNHVGGLAVSLSTWRAWIEINRTVQSKGKTTNTVLKEHVLGCIDNDHAEPGNE